MSIVKNVTLLKTRVSISSNSELRSNKKLCNHPNESLNGQQGMKIMRSSLKSLNDNLLLESKITLTK